MNFETIETHTMMYQSGNVLSSLPQLMIGSVCVCPVFLSPILETDIFFLSFEQKICFEKLLGSWHILWIFKQVQYCYNSFLA